MKKIKIMHPMNKTSFPFTHFPNLSLSLNPAFGEVRLRRLSLSLNQNGALFEFKN